MDRNESIMEQRKASVLAFIKDEQYKPMKFKEMAGFLQVPKGERGELREILEKLEQEGKITIDVKGRFHKAEETLSVGTFSATLKGFGFVIIDGEEEDVFIPPEAVGTALNNDRVQVEILKESRSGRRREGIIRKIVERARDTVVGTFAKSKNFGFVIADDQKFGKDIFISKSKTMGAVSGHKVVVRITDYGEHKKNPEGEVIEILGHINDPGVDIMSVIKAYGLPEEYPKEVMKQAEHMPEEVSEDQLAGRTDLRTWQTVTIDGEDAKDLDDAITLTKEGDVYTLGVHIADVSHYVREGSPLDKEALKRGTSVYLVDRVIPMLPHRLSNGICSLNQGCDRLTLSCIMEINANGNVVSHRIVESVIHVDRRMSYTAVKKILEDQDSETIEEYRELVPMFEQMLELSKILREKRHKRGSIDFDFQESKILLDEKGKPVDIKPYDRNCATKIIEDFMLLANETVAEDFFWQELPFVYRTHEVPDMEKIQKLGIFINNFGYSMHVSQDEIHPKELQKLLEKIEGTPEEAVISRLTLRSMKQAKYTTENTGHFGLSAKYYCHFTSPIRRYPDLQIHRIIKENIHTGLSEKRIRHYEAILPEVAVQSSMMERRAEEAERETDKMKKAEYMRGFLGEEFDGIISGITAWGIYVELPNTIEGMVRVTDLRDDYYYYDEEKFCMVGEHTNKVYSLGQKVRIVVTGADKQMGTIDFEMR
jgi:ribonuclease R